MFRSNVNSTFYEYPCANSSVCHSIDIVLSPGIYVLEVWGASGGANSSENSALGGYSYGILTLREETKAFIYLGGLGICKTTGDRFTGTAFNGGGSGSKLISHAYSGSGGGASDIRLVNDSLHNRIIVAGGGGGSGSYQIQSKGGAGGGLEGKDGDEGIENANTAKGGKGGGQESDDLSRFGIGESHKGNQNGSNRNACGGDGGWFGGGAGVLYAAGGGGGSGFVYTTYNSLVHLSERYFLKSAYTISGDDPRVSYYGNGRARITLISFVCSYQQSKFSLHWLPLIACFIMRK